MAHEEATAPPVQVKVTVEFSGEGAQVAAMLEAVSRVLSSSPAYPAPAADSSWWTADTATAFIRRLKRPALHALRTIAAGAPKVRVSVVQREMQLAGLPMTPGGLSSIGFAVRALGAPAPFVRDNYQRVYLMDPEVATILLRAIEAEHDRRQPE